MFDKIYNPYTLKFIDFPSKEGLMLLSNYMSGGANQGRKQVSQYNNGKNNRMSRQSSNVIRRHEKYMDKKLSQKQFLNNKVKNELLDKYLNKIKYVDTQPGLLEIYNDSLKYLPRQYRDDANFHTKKHMSKLTVFMLIFLIMNLKFGYGEAGEAMDKFKKLNLELLEFREVFNEDMRLIDLSDADRQAKIIKDLENNFVGKQKEMNDDYVKLSNVNLSKDKKKILRKTMIKKWHPDMTLSKKIREEFKNCKSCLEALKKFQIKILER